MSDLERRTVEARAAVEGTRLVGYASVFDEETRIRDFHERVDRAAFDRALRENQPVALLVNHDGLPLATTYGGTLNLSTDAHGLRMAAGLPDTSLGRDVRELTSRGDLRSMSFGFVVRDEEWSVRDDGAQLRTIKDVDLFDVSVVTFPAYAGTEVSLRNRPAPTDVPRVTARGQHALIRARLRIGK